MTSMKTVYISRPPTPCLSNSKNFLCPIFNEPPIFKPLYEAFTINQREKLSYDTIVAEAICIRTHQCQLFENTTI